MKLILLMYLEDDEKTVERLLEEHGVSAFSRFPLEGHGQGRPSGWYGRVAPYRSRMVFTAVPEERANDLMEAVARCRGCKDSRHPVHALQLAVERSTESGAASTAGPG